MASYRRSEFLGPNLSIVRAALATQRAVDRPGRGIDELERESSSVPEVAGGGGITILQSLSESEPGSALARAVPPFGGDEGGLGELEGLSPSNYFNRRPVDLSEVEDGRLFHPEHRKIRVSKTVRGSKTRLDASSLPQMAGRVVHAVSARSVITCIRRSIRREVIFAKGRAGANRYVPPQNLEVCE